MKNPGYVQRTARISAVLSYLVTHPDGLPLQALADRFNTGAGPLREDLLAYYMASTLEHDQTFLGLSRAASLEFTNSEGAEIDPNDATWVRLIDERPAEDIGAEYLDSSELGLLWTAAQALQELEPENTVLRRAMDVLEATLFEEIEPSSVRTSAGLAGHAGTEETRAKLEVLRTAVQDSRHVRIRYSRAWSVGESERVIAPHLLVQTQRGWEVDAGAVEADGALRTFLLGNIRSCTLLEDGSPRPADLAERLRANRATTRVRVSIPHDARWAADMYAEAVHAVEDDEVFQTVDLDLLQPVAKRLGLLLLAAGEDSRVVDPPRLMASALETARELLAHHRAVPAE